MEVMVLIDITISDDGNNSEEECHDEKVLIVIRVGNGISFRKNSAE
jgi:hypothetical protein